MTATAGHDRAAILAARAEAARRPRFEEEEPEAIEMLFFRTGSERYALRSKDVAAVHRVADLVPVPGAPRAIRGVALFAGEIFALADPGVLVGSSGRGLADFRHAIVVDAPSRRAGLALLAAEVEGIERIAPRTLRSWDGERLGEQDARAIEGLVGDDRALLDLSALIERLEKAVMER